MLEELKRIIESTWEKRDLLKVPVNQEAIREVIEMLDKGSIRVAEPPDPHEANDVWKVNEWIKKAVILYFPIREMKTTELGIFEFHDKIDLKKNYKELGVRVVPHAIARYGAYLARGVVMMPSYVNIGAYVDSGPWWTPGQLLAPARK